MDIDRLEREPGATPPGLLATSAQPPATSTDGSDDPVLLNQCSTRV